MTSPDPPSPRADPSGPNRFPGGAAFAFSIFDDTDFAQVATLRPVYDFLADLGLRTTKSVWPLAGDDRAGLSLEDPDYRTFVLRLRDLGFEIALHNVRNVSSQRPVIERGLQTFRDIIGQYPRTHCNHCHNRDNLYWAVDRFSGPAIRLGYQLATRFKWAGVCQGHREGSMYFWGDLCREHVRYVRNMVFREVNLDRINPHMPYHDPAKPYVNAWFSSCEGSGARSFCQTLGEHNQEQLEAEGGVCIMYTHFALGFCQDGRLHPRFKRLIERLASRPGWFVPVATLLDHLKRTRHGDGPGLIDRHELRRMERKWLLTKLREGTS